MRLSDFKASNLILPLALSNACFPRADLKEPITPDCDYAGVNTEVQADIEAGITDAELVQIYGSKKAIRTTLDITEGASFVGGEIEDAEGNTTSFYCLAPETGVCMADVYTGCEDQEPLWNVTLNDPIQAVSCDWVLAEEETAPDHAPACTLDAEGTFFSVDGN